MGAITILTFLFAFLFSSQILFAEPKLLPLPLPEGAPEEIKAQGPIIDYTSDGSIRYNLSEDALVQIRLGIQGDPELVNRTLVDWEYRKSGENTELWDGKDSGGNLVDKERIVIKLGTRPIQSEILSSCVYSPDGKKEEEKHVDHRHEAHDQTKCKEIRLRLVNPVPGENLSGVSNITVEVDPERCGYGQTTGHGMRIYIDDERIHEEYFTHTGTLTISLNTKEFTNRRHKLTINVCDHNDHVGTVSTMIDIEN